jgi:hypothetical protein
LPAPAATWCPAERTVTVGIGHGKKAARHIDAWLRGAQHLSPPKHELATFDKLNPWCYSDAPATVRPQLDAARRRSTFDEVIGGSMNPTHWSRRAGACRAATASRAITVAASAPAMPW